MFKFIFKKQNTIKKLDIDMQKDIIIKYPEVKGEMIGFVKNTLIERIKQKTFKNTRKDILKNLPFVIRNVKNRKDHIDIFLKKYNRTFKNCPGEVKTLLLNSSHFNKEVQKIVVKKLKEYSIKKAKVKQKKRLNLPPEKIKYLEWRDEILTNIQNKNKVLICDNPSSEYHIRQIPLDIGGTSPDELLYNDSNKFLATIDHIYPKKHFKDLEYNEENIQILCREENIRKGGDVILDYRHLHITNFLNFAKDRDLVIKQWPNVLNTIHQMPVFRKTKGEIFIYAIDLILDGSDFIILGSSKKENQFGKLNYDLKWDLDGKYLGEKPNKKKDLNIQYNYLKKFEIGNKMDLVLKTI